MRILTYSDLHLEFGTGWTLPQEADGDLMILAGDVITLKDYKPLDQMLQRWKKPVLCVTGNHEYYTRRPMNQEDANFGAWLEGKHPHAKLLLDEHVTIDGVNFFGGTMWTDFDGRNPQAMERARSEMNDFQLICNADGSCFKPTDAIGRHEQFVAKLHDWLDKDMSGPRVVISHSAPLINPRTKYRNSPLPGSQFPGHGCFLSKNDSRYCGSTAIPMSAIIKRWTAHGSFRISSDIRRLPVASNAGTLIR